MIILLLFLIHQLIIFHSLKTTYVCFQSVSKSLSIGVGTKGGTGVVGLLTFRPKLFLKSFPSFANTIFRHGEW